MLSSITLCLIKLWNLQHNKNGEKEFPFCFLVDAKFLFLYLLFKETNKGDNVKNKMLLTTQNAKTSKGEDLGYLTGILYMAPANMVEGVNVCKFASVGCKKACLYSAGRGKFSNVQKARIAKTEFFRDNLEGFKTSLVWSINSVIRKASKQGLKPCIRLNGTSDIPYETLEIKDGKNIFEVFPEIQFYDYTADHTRLKALTGTWKNYHLTFSRKESRANNVAAEKLLSIGVNVAAVYSNIDKALQDDNKINGDLHDLRFLDGHGGKIVALKAKGDAKKDTSGFVIHN
jgi:hypothetical protein